MPRLTGGSCRGVRPHTFACRIALCKCRQAGHVCSQMMEGAGGTTDKLKGFGCRQAYESLSCRNPRAAGGELWGFVFRGFPAAVANVRVRCYQGVEEVASGQVGETVAMTTVGFGYRETGATAKRTWHPVDRRRRGAAVRSTWPCRVMGRSPGLALLRQAVARGWHHRSNLSMTTMRPPQQEQGGRTSAGSSGMSSSGGGATFSSSRASARLASRAEPASSP